MRRSGFINGGQTLARLAILLGTGRLFAPDLWIEPTSFSPEPGQVVGVRLRVGQDLLGDPVPHSAALIKDFVFEDRTGRRPVPGRDGLDPAGYVRAEHPGLVVIGYHSQPSRVALAAEKFDRYLQEEGLERIAAQRAREQNSGASVPEVFSRCAKSLLWSGKPEAAEEDRPLGCTFELVAERNPYTLGVDEELPLRLTYENQPLPGALVVAMNRSNPAEKLSARSDELGRVRFRLQAKGLWLIKAVHMVPAAPASQADWASFWASLTFDRRPEPAQGR